MLHQITFSKRNPYLTDSIGFECNGEFQYYALLWNYKKVLLTLVITKLCSQKEWFQSQNTFYNLIEKNIVFGLTFVSHPVKVSPDIPNRNRKGIKWDIFLIFFDIRNPRLLLSHLHENFREKWFLEKKCTDYFNFFLGLMLEVCPHFFLRQLVALGWRRA